MTEAAIRKRLDDLIRTITASPFTGQAAMDPSSGVYRVETSSQEASVETCLDHLRLQVKYLLFDLEATRRENRYLRQMLESRHKRDLDDLKGDGPEAT
jgi:hypothetical protein